LVNFSSAVFKHIDELFFCGTDPVETVANGLGTCWTDSHTARWNADSLVASPQ
jgi:hypothetical protein